MSLFQKRHYEWLAARLREFIKDDPDYGGVAAIKLSGQLARDNPNFNRDRFEKACGLTVVKS